jgi:hypothetical protein
LAADQAECLEEEEEEEGRVAAAILLGKMENPRYLNEVKILVFHRPKNMQLKAAAL